MPKPFPRIDPAFEKAVQRMLATPPQPKKAVKKKDCGEKAEGPPQSLSEAAEAR
jgi:hypothetical protein